MDHVISADKSKTIEIQKKTMDWTGKLVELFSRANTEGIHMAIQGLRTKYNADFDASELFKELDQIQPAETHWIFTSPAAMIGIALAIFLIGMLIWKKCFSTPSSMEAPPPAHLAPPMPIHNQPQICRTSNQQSGHQIKCVYPYSDQHLMKKLPKKGRDIGTIFEATSMMNFNKTPSAKTILL
jgi:hypothetical protein